MTVPLTKYVDRLPIPRVLRPIRRSRRATYYRVRMRQVLQQLHRDLPPTIIWGYSGVYPGPTIIARRDEQVCVEWLNDLPDTHILPVDTTLHGAGPDQPQVRTVVHLHGGNTPAHSDGYPEAWFTPGFGKVGPKFVRRVYHYPNHQPATALWYHDHAIGITRLNVYAGLAGLYLIRDKHEASLNLPKGRYEIPLVVQDRSFNPDGSLFYPSQPTPPVVGVNPSCVPEFFGDTILVNGKVWPYLDVEPRRYRLRILNGCGSRFLRMKLPDGVSWAQIGSDQGFLDSPVRLDSLTLAPAERADVVIDFAGHECQDIVLTNDAPTPFPDGDAPDPATTGEVMQFRVCRCHAGDTSSDPERLPLVPASIGTADRARDLTLVEMMDSYGRLLQLLSNMMWDDPVTEKPVLGSAEVWRLINLTMDTHPIHLHLVRFRLLSRQPFDVQHYVSTGELVYAGPATGPEPNEQGPKDTVRANPGEVTQIQATFVDYPGAYVWHCHIIEHEDHDMMRPMEVIRPEPVKHEKRATQQPRRRRISPRGRGARGQ